MSCDLILHTLLKNNATLSGLIGGRLFPVSLPPKFAFPAVVTALVIQEPNRTVSGTEPTRLVRGSALAVAMARSTSDLNTLCRAVIGAANRHIGPTGAFTITTSHYTRSESDQFDVELDVYSRAMFFAVSYVESQP
jgi:hypothetical protein